MKTVNISEDELFDIQDHVLLEASRIELLGELFTNNNPTSELNRLFKKIYPHRVVVTIDGKIFEVAGFKECKKYGYDFNLIRSIS